MSRRSYFQAITMVVVGTLVFRIALGSRASFTGDDFGFRASMDGSYSIDRVLAGHNGHLNPLGLTMQWIVQHAFPGRFVPLMVLSAFLVSCSQLAAAAWVSDVFGARWLGVAAATVTGLSPMLLELATWWSVALYAAPMVATAWLTVWVSTRYMYERASLGFAVGSFWLCLASSTKAALVPILLVGLAAGLGLGRAQALGLRKALSTYRRLWMWLSASLLGYAAIYVAYRGPTVTADPSLSQMAKFITELLRTAALPAVWGGPGAWVSLGFHAAPAPPPWLVTVSAFSTLVALGMVLFVRPKRWPIVVSALSYVTLSTLVVALGRAGSPWGAPVMRYTFDLVLPLVLVLCTGIADTRWELRRDIGRGLATGVRGTLWIAASVAWATSLVITYALPWKILPQNPMKEWIATARTSYPMLQDGLLQQWAPPEVARFREEVGVFLAGDPGRPPEVRYMMDRVLGFDGQGHLVQRNLVGVSSVPAAECTYRATASQPAIVPLTSTMPDGRYTVALDYMLNIDTPAYVGLSNGQPLPMSLPMGIRRVYAVIDGEGGSVTITVSNPVGQMCILSVTVGDLVDGPIVASKPS